MLDRGQSVLSRGPERVGQRTRVYWACLTINRIYIVLVQ